MLKDVLSSGDLQFALPTWIPELMRCPYRCACWPVLLNINALPNTLLFSWQLNYFITSGCWQTDCQFPPSIFGRKLEYLHELLFQSLLLIQNVTRTLDVELEERKNRQTKWIIGAEKGKPNGELICVQWFIGVLFSCSSSVALLFACFSDVTQKAC